MRILHVLSSSNFSGAENVACQIINMFRDHQDIEMAYCSVDGPIRNALEERNILFFPIREMSLAEMKRVINEFKPDIIHAHDMRASFFSAISCGNVKLISHIHNNAYDSRGMSIKSVAYLFAAIKADKIFWVSKSSLNGYYFNKLILKKSIVLYNITDVSEIEKRVLSDGNNYDYDVVYVGRITYQKNPQRLLNVFHKVYEIDKNIKVAIVGDGNKNDIEEIIDSLQEIIKY